MKYLKKIIFRSVSLESYLRVLQWGFFFLYHTKLLKLSENYSFHYFAKKIIRKGDVIIDIGANLGYYSLLFARWTGKTGAIHAVEPIGIFNRVFNKRAGRYEHIRLYPFALGAEEKMVDLVSPSHTGYLRTGLLHIYDQQKDGVIENAEFHFKAQMKKPFELFGSLDRIDYIKCDVEGFEYIVLSEMKEIIGRHKPKIQVEIGKENEKEINGMFQDMGYIPYRLINNRLISPENCPDGTRGDYLFLHSQHVSMN